MPDNKLQIIIEAVDETKEAFNDLKNNSERVTSSLKAGWLEVTTKIAIATAAFYAAKRIIYDTAKEIASMTNAIERQAGILGISTDELQKWQYAAKMSDVNAEELALGLKLLSRNMEDASTGSGEASKYFSAMGISVKTTEGHLRPLNEIMMEIMDKFASWEDGPRKIAIAIQLFGRSGETLIPLLNKGRTGFEEFAREAQKLGIILDPNVISAGSKTEDIFKRLEAQITATKLSLTPLALEFAKAVDSILKDFNRLNDWLKTNKTTDWFPQIGELNKWLKENSIENWRERLGIPSKKRVEQRGEEEKELMRGRIKAYTATAQIAPAEIGKEIDIVKETQAAIEGLMAAEDLRGQVAIAQHELIEGGWIKEEDIVEQVKNELANLEREANEWGEVTIGRQELVEAGWAAIAKAEAEAIREGLENAKLLHEAWKEKYFKTGTDLTKIFEDAGSNISRIWSDNFQDMLTGTKSFAEGVQGIFAGMGNYILSVFTQMAANWALFGSIAGIQKGVKMGGLFGMLGFQEGGSFWVNRPTPIMVGEGGEKELVNITPESQLAETGAGVSLTLINVSDPQQLQQVLATSLGNNIMLNFIGENAGIIRKLIL